MSTRSVVVTGCGAGIGRAIFEQLLKSGWYVVGVEIDPELAQQAIAAAHARQHWGLDDLERGLHWPSFQFEGRKSVQQTIRDTLRDRKEQLLRAAYLAVARDEAKVTNYLAQQVVETAGKLPDAARSTLPPVATPTPVGTKPTAPANTQ